MKRYKYLLTYLVFFIYLSVPQNFTIAKNNTEKMHFHDFYHENNVDFTYKTTIRTVQLKREDWNLSYPVLDMNDQLPLVLSFDDLVDDPVTYSYTLIHCNSNWEPTRIIKNDYLDGMHEEIIRDYEFSQNTHQNYIHYSLEIPNSDMRPTLSGNYIIKVFEDYNEEKVVLTRRFFLVDYKVEIDGEAKRSNNLEYFYTHQEVDFKILHDRLPIDDPHQNIRVVVVQNFDWQTAKTELRPTFTAPGELIYDYEEENQFFGLSEFRHFDTKNLKYITEGIDYIRFERPLNHVYLLPDKSRSVGDYIYEEDINGKFLVTYHLDYDPDTGADYVRVHFNLPFDGPISGGQMYVYGALSDWAISPEFRMEFNMNTKSYELPALLKQGYYNYQYRFVPDSGLIDPSFIEGSFYETENDYLIFIYYHNFSDRHQQLIGFQVLNSANNNL